MEASWSRAGAVAPRKGPEPAAGGEGPVKPVHSPSGPGASGDPQTQSPGGWGL